MRQRERHREAPRAAVADQRRLRSRRPAQRSFGRAARAGAATSAVLVVSGLLVGLAAGPAAAAVPPTPTGVAVAPSAAGAVRVTWDPSAGATSYAVEQTDSGGGNATAVAAGTCSTTAMPSGCTVTGLTAGATYNFVVIATNVDGSSIASTPISVDVINPPATPAGPTAAVAPGSAMVAVTFAASGTPAAPVASTHILVQTDGTGLYVPVSAGTCTGASPVSPCTFAGSATHSYKFEVKATNALASATSAPSTPAVVAITPPAAPDLPTAAVAPGTAQLKVTFTTTATAAAPVASVAILVQTDGAGGYAAVPGGSGTCAAASPVSPCLFTGVAGHNYSFEVAATNAAGTAHSAATAPVTAIVTAGAPTIGGVAVTAPLTVSVHWTPPSTNAPGTTYTVFMLDNTNPDPAGYTAVGSCPSVHVSPCAATGLVAGDDYTFEVGADTGAGVKSGPSAHITAIDLPGTPGTPMVTVAQSQTMTLTWTAPDTAAGAKPVDTYQVTESIDGGSFIPAPASCASTAMLTCTISNIAIGARYDFKVIAVNAAGPSALAAASSPAASIGRPAAPTGASAVGNGADTVLISWTGSAGGATSYNVYSATAAGGPFTTAVACDSTPSPTSCIVTAAAGTPIYFEVTGVIGGVESDRSTATAAVTPANTPGTPSGVRASLTDTPVAGPPAVTVTWTAPGSGPAVVSYQVQAAAGTGAFGPVSGPCATTTSSPCAVSTGLQYGIPYQFRVVAVNVAGPGLASVPSAMLTLARSIGPIMSGFAGKCVDNYHNGVGQLVGKVDIYACNQTNAQNWTVQGDGTLQNSGRCLDVDHGGAVNRSRIDLFACNGTGAQQWAAGANGSLVNTASGKCIDDPAGSLLNGTQLQLFTCNGTPAQRWTPPAPVHAANAARAS